MRGGLPAWNDTQPERSIIAFVERVTTEGTSDFVPVAERIAAFDNDGTIWAEQPLYTQVVDGSLRRAADTVGSELFTIVQAQSLVTTLREGHGHPPKAAARAKRGQAK